MRYSVGQKVKVIRRISKWESSLGIGSWVDPMNRTLNKTYTILVINKSEDCQLGTADEDYQLDTADGDRVPYNYWYTKKSLEPCLLVGQQLTFDFMEAD